MKITKVIHPLWESWQDMLKVPNLSPLLKKMGPLIGKYHYTLKSDRGMVTLIQVGNPGYPYFDKKKMSWEACSNGKFWEGTRGFRTKEEAMVIIKGFLN